jgi:phosphoribosylanthranilate isomerase
MKFRIKICGVTNIADAQAAAEAGADAIGLNFYQGSKRFISAEAARQVADAVRHSAEPVGVFVNAPASFICETCREVILNTVQLHGEERPDSCKLLIGLRQLGLDYPDLSLSIIRAHSFGEGGLQSVYKDMFDSSGEAADAVLVDAAVSGMYGGTGQIIDWRQLVGYEASIGRVPLILAGGLTPDNVAEAIRVVRPQAVDVASGVESSPGKKDHAKVRDFVTAAREAFERIESDAS